MVDFPSNYFTHNGTQHIIKSYYVELCLIPSPTYTISYHIRLINHQTTTTNITSLSVNTQSHTKGDEQGQVHNSTTLHKLSESVPKLFTNFENCEGKNHKHLINTLFFKPKQFMLTKKIQEKSTHSYFRRRCK